MVISAIAKALMNSRLRRGQIAHSIVLEADYRRGANSLSRTSASRRLHVAPFAFKSQMEESQNR